MNNKDHLERLKNITHGDCDICVTDGVTLGKLTVVNKVSKVKGRTAWLCKCLCGNEKIIIEGSLKRKNKPTRSCGCLTGSPHDITGKRYGRLVALSVDGRSKDRHIKWSCLCDCGNKVSVIGRDLRNGDTKSCGCLFMDCISSHKMSHYSLYSVWIGMKQRCYNENSKSFRSYGGRGIKICDRWLESFENFYADMGNAPDGTSIDRIDNDGDYEPLNCRRATSEEQNQNKRTNKLNPVAVNVARYLHSKGRSISDIANAYKTNSSTLSVAISHKTWCNV